MWVQSLGWEDPLEKGMATYSSILVWENPMDKEPWQATGSQRVTHDWHFHFHLVKGNGSEALRTRSEKGKKAEMKIER